MSAAPARAVKGPKQEPRSEYIPTRLANDHPRGPLDTSDDTSSVRTFEIYEDNPLSSKSSNQRVIESNEFYDYADHIQASGSTSRVASASLVTRLRKQADATPSSNETAWFDDGSSRASSSQHDGLKPRVRSLSDSGSQHDPKMVLRLMHETRGLMHGFFVFRLGYDQEWTRSEGYITPSIGSLVHSSNKKDIVKTLVPDLRLCRVAAVSDLSTRDLFLRLRISKSGNEVHFTPSDSTHFNAWFAAFLCWRSIAFQRRPASASRTKRPSLSTEPLDVRKHNDKATWRGSQILRQENVVLLEPSYTPLASQLGDCVNGHHTSYPRLPRDVKRIKASCTLRGTGLLNLDIGTESNRTLSIPIHQIPRSAIQRADYSMFHSNLVLAIRPRCTPGNENDSRFQPFYIAVQSRESLETWYVLLQTLATPEMYGSQQSSTTHDEFSLDVDLPRSGREARPMIRILHGLKIRVNKVQFQVQNKRNSRSMDPTSRQSLHAQSSRPSRYYVEILIDDQLYAVTASKSTASDLLHVYETLSLVDIPSQLCTVGFRIRRRDPPQVTSPGASHSSINVSNNLGEYVDDSVVGELRYGPIILTDITHQTIIELNEIRSWARKDQVVPLIQETGETLGEISVNIEHEQEVMMAEREYEKVTESFDKLAVPLSLAVSEHAQPQELPRIAERLLNIFLTCGNAEDWLKALAQKEIKASHDRSGSGASQAEPSTQSSGDSRLSSPPTEVGLLFRGNTLLSKALDLYMKRIGQRYLEDTLKKKMREIAIYEPDCEVDPAKLSANSNLDKNWRRLLDLTEEVWQLIFRSAERCPMQLRVIFQHINSLARRRYRKSAPTARYTSVSGFLFLRFFCPATLNPHLFGLVEEDTSLTAPVAHRSFMLVAKALQGLANMTAFGSKETWMEPMNHFVTAHREEFTQFIDQICSVSSDYIPPDGLETHLIAHSSTRAQYMRLSAVARDGIPSLPYLIDKTRDIAALIQLIAERQSEGSKRLSTISTSSVASSDSISSACSSVPSFQSTCMQIHAKTTRLLAQVESKDHDDISDTLLMKWASTAERMETRPYEFWISGTAEELYPDVKPDARTKEPGNSRLPFFRKTDREKEKEKEDRQTRPMSNAPSQRSTGSSASAEKKKKQKSPPRNAQDNAMRKLGWM